jgi:16S rRNA (cytosine1402-N4)-methyltransferase
MSDRGHIPVMLAECLDALAPNPGGTYVDCTAGLGGHAAAVGGVLARTGGGTVIINDADPLNLALAAENVRGQSPGVAVHVVTGNFAELPNKLPSLTPGQNLRADMVLADLGFASTQVDDPARGFSFSHDGPLDMRLDPTLPVSAAELVNGMSETELVSLIERFGEDRNARRIAAKLVRARAENPIQTTGQLADLVRSASPGQWRGKGGNIDPATRTFQALRMAVNDEVGSLEALLSAAVRDAERLAKGQEAAWLKAGARLAVLSFHSLEDRPVKQAFAAIEKLGGIDLTNGPRVAGEEELERNPRSRSAKLRAVRLPG